MTYFKLALTAATVLFAVSCAKQYTATSSSQVMADGIAADSVQESQHIQDKQTFDFNALEILSAYDKAGDNQRGSILDDTVLPMPDVSLSTNFINNDSGENGEYYEEFKEFNVPMAMTGRVSAYINYFTKRVPKTTQAWLSRSNKYMYIVQDIFVKEGLPTDLAVLAFTESGFNTHAVSHAGAAGMWQFIPSTGRLYGMKTNFWLDERRDFEKATYAAAKYLKDLYARFGDWYLALAAYNAGPGKVARAVKKHNTKDFFKISKSRYTLKLETRDYVPKFLAQLIIYKNYLKYNFEPPTEKPLLYSTINIDSQVNIYWLARELNIDSKDLTELNPALKLPITPPGEYFIRVPYGKEAEARTAIAKAHPQEMAMYTVYEAKQGEKIAAIAKKHGSTLQEVKALNGLKYDTVFASRPLFIPIEGITDRDIDKEFSKVLASMAPQYYRVKKGDTFIAIAHRHNMRLADLQKLNPNVRASRIYPGQSLVVSEGAVTAKRQYTAKKSTVAKKQPIPSNGQYRVRSGDSLWSIAKKFGTTVDALMAANNMSGVDIQAGKIIYIK